jgi:hypothetical protein
VKCQIYNPVLYPKEKKTIPIEWDTGWNLELVWSYWRKENFSLLLETEPNLFQPIF